MLLWTGLLYISVISELELEVYIDIFVIDQLIYELRSFERNLLNVLDGSLRLGLLVL